MTLGVRQGKKEKVAAATEGTGQGFLPFPPFHSGLRVQDEINAADAARGIGRNIRETRKRTSARKNGPAVTSERPLFDDIRTVASTKKVRQRPKIEAVDMGEELRRATDLLENAARKFAIRCFTLIAATGRTHNIMRLRELEGKVLTSHETGRAFKHPDRAVVEAMWEILTAEIGPYKGSGMCSRSENYGKLCGASAAFSAMDKVMKAHWLLKSAGMTQFLEYSNILKSRKSKTGVRSGKPQRATSDKMAVGCEEYVEALKIVRKLAGADWRRKPEQHPKLGRIVSLAAGEILSGGRPLIYAKLRSANIGAVAGWEKQLAKEIEVQIGTRLKKGRCSVGAVHTSDFMPAGDAIVSTKFFKFAQIDAATPPITLILNYDTIWHREKKFAAYPARTLNLVSK